MWNRHVWVGSTLTLVALVAVLVVAFGAATAPAGNRDPVSTLAASPGPQQVTFGQSVALTATLLNRQSSTFTDVRFRAPIPAGVTFKATSCAQFQLLPAGNPTEFVCDWGHQLRSGETASVLFVLQTPGTGTSPMTITGAWAIKEGSQTKGGGPDTFPTNPAAVSLIAANDPAKAGGFATTACTNPSIPTLATNPALGLGNPLATSVCAPNLPTIPIPGIVAGINEFDRTLTDPGVTQISDICLPAPGFGCGTTPFVFSSLATFTFRIDNTQLPPVCTHDDDGDDDCRLQKITQVFHDGVLVSSSPTADPRVVSITFNSTTKITTVVVLSSQNGKWGFG